MRLLIVEDHEGTRWVLGKICRLKLLFGSRGDFSEDTGSASATRIE